MDAQEPDAESEDVTAVTSAVENRFAQRRADALTTMAETTLRHGPGQLSAGDRYQVVVHVSAETLADDDSDGRCELDNGQRLAPDTVRRIACDGSLLHLSEDIAGNPLDIGRKTRVVPPSPPSRARRRIRSREDRRRSHSFHAARWPGHRRSPPASRRSLRLRENLPGEHPQVSYGTAHRETRTTSQTSGWPRPARCYPRYHRPAPPRRDRRRPGPVHGNP